jgi:hypothetical protein
MDSMTVVVLLEPRQLLFKVTGCPIEGVIQEFPPYRTDQPFDERMGQGNVRDSLHLCDFKDPQVGLPLSELKQRIVIAAQVKGQGILAGNNLVEHPADSGPVDIADMHSESDDASCELVHDDHGPVRLKEQGFAAKQIDRP